jgi:hypothetical protein
MNQIIYKALKIYDDQKPFRQHILNDFCKRNPFANPLPERTIFTEDGTILVFKLTI